jgi:hypothetical protein
VLLGEERLMRGWIESLIVAVVVVRCARRCGGCFFEALGGVGALVVDAGVARCFAAAVVVAPGITAE